MPHARAISADGQQQIIEQARQLGLLSGETDFTGGQLAPGGQTAHLEMIVNGRTLQLTGLADPIPAAMLDPMMPESIDVLRITGSGMLTVGQVSNAITYAAGQNALQITGYDMLGTSVHTLVEDDLRAGDHRRSDGRGRHRFHGWRP